MLQKEDIQFRVQLWNDVLGKVRQFFAERQYLEVSTPLLVRSPGMEPNLSPLEVSVHTVGPRGRQSSCGLITSPEYSMKKLLGGGMERIFTLAQVFRNEESPGNRWGIEFTMLEWYRQHADYHVLMTETVDLINFVLGWDGVWQRVSYVNEFERVMGFVPSEASTESLRMAWIKNSMRGEFDGQPLHESIDQLFYECVLPTVQRSKCIMICEFPVPCASLAATSLDGRHAERFEAFVDDLELCNGFTELTNPQEQRQRFLIEAHERAALGKTVFPIDEELLERLESVASPTYGNALGIDRLVMLYAGVKDIDSVHVFPPSLRY